MYRLSFILAVILLIVLFSYPTQAHIAGQPPFFKIDNKYADFYPVSVTSLKDFPLPQDSAPENYLINQPLTFVIDTDRLPFPDPVLEKTTFTWDFGDGEKGEGIENTHTYTKPGSYLLTINADYGDYQDANTKPVIQAVLLNILPHKDYRLPQAAISIDKKTIQDPQNNSVTTQKSSPVMFSAEKSQVGTSPIVSYLWDLGQGVEKKDKSFTYTYSSSDPVYLFPFVRIVDSQGFISDTYIQLDRSEETKKGIKDFLISPLFLILGGVNLVIIMGTVYLLKKH